MKNRDAVIARSPPLADDAAISTKPWCRVFRSYTCQDIVGAVRQRRPTAQISEMPSDMKKIVSPFNAAAATYSFLLIVYLAASSFPQYRVWGLNLWAYYPASVPWALFGGGVLAVAALWLVGHRTNRLEEKDKQDISVSIFWATTAALTLLMTVLFYYLRTRTCFLGDGYTVLSMLADPEPMVKVRNYGAAMLHIWVKQILGEGEPAALAGFQSISIGCGLLFLLSTAFLSRRLFDNNRDRILLLIGLATCGYMYNFFGYVENYSLFILTSLLYCMTGLLVSLGRAPRWTLLPLLGLTLLSHIFGVMLIPSAVYLLIANTRISNRIASLAPRTKWLMAVVMSVIAVATFLHFYFNNYYFRFAIVPLLPDRFTVEGYHLFSIPHLLDIVNLALLLTPALPVVILLALDMPMKSISRRSEYRYLALLVLSCWAAVVIFDPKLGMPRDWDLFSFAGVPLSLLSFYLVLDKRTRPRSHAPIALMMTLMGLMVLFPRAVSQTNPDQSVQWFNNYAALDKAKNMYGRTLLRKYPKNLKGTAADEREYKRFVVDYPQFALNREGIALKQERKFEEAIAKFRQALDLHPAFAASYANMGTCFGGLHQPDSAIAYLEIATGMNPYNWRVWNNLATAYFTKGAYNRAEEYLLKARKIGPTEMEPMRGLVQVYKRKNDLANWFASLNELVARDDAPVLALTELAEYHLNNRQFLLAAPLYRRAVMQGLDSTYVAQLRQNYPQLGL